MDLENAHLEAIIQTMPIEDFPNYRPYTEPVPLYGPDYSTWTLRDLLHSGMLTLDYEGTQFVDILQKWNSGPLEEHLQDCLSDESLLKIVLSWQRIASKTPADLRLFPEFPFNLKIGKDCKIQPHGETRIYE